MEKYLIFPGLSKGICPNGERHDSMATTFLEGALLKFVKNERESRFFSKLYFRIRSQKFPLHQILAQLD